MKIQSFSAKISTLRHICNKSSVITTLCFGGNWRERKSKQLLGSRNEMEGIPRQQFVASKLKHKMETSYWWCSGYFGRGSSTSRFENFVPVKKIIQRAIFAVLAWIEALNRTSLTIAQENWSSLPHLLENSLLVPLHTSYLEKNQTVDLDAGIRYCDGVWQWHDFWDVVQFVK